MAATTYNGDDHEKRNDDRVVTKRDA